MPKGSALIRRARRSPPPVRSFLPLPPSGRGNDRQCPPPPGPLPPSPAVATPPLSPWPKVLPLGLLDQGWIPNRTLFPCFPAEHPSTPPQWMDLPDLAAPVGRGVAALQGLCSCLVKFPSCRPYGNSSPSWPPARPPPSTLPLDWHRRICPSCLAFKSSLSNRGMEPDASSPLRGSPAPRFPIVLLAPSSPSWLSPTAYPPSSLRPWMPPRSPTLWKDCQMQSCPASG